MQLQAFPQVGTTFIRTLRVKFLKKYEQFKHIPSPGWPRKCLKIRTFADYSALHCSNYFVYFDIINFLYCNTIVLNFDNALYLFGILYFFYLRKKAFLQEKEVYQNLQPFLNTAPSSHDTVPHRLIRLRHTWPKGRQLT